LACTPAFAQTVATSSAAQALTVSIYGIVDAAAYSKQLSGERKLTSLQSGGMSTSRIGLAGGEDLGDGLRASFDLSGFLRVDTGESGRNAADTFWGRYAYVGLSSPSLGAIRLGRIATAWFQSAASFGAFLDSSVFGPYLLHTYIPSAAQPMITAKGMIDSAWNNSISYSVPAISGIPGLVASLQISAGEGGTAGRRVGSGVTYRSDRWGATFTFDDVSRAAMAVGAPTAAQATPSRPLYTATDARTYQGGAYYDFQVVRLSAQLNRTRFSNHAASEIQLTTSAFSATVPIGRGNLLAERAHTNDDRTGLTTLKRNTVSIGYDYFLSKRTDTYAVATHDKVTNIASGTGWGIGVRHRF
jgi:predicted porin